MQLTLTDEERGALLAMLNTSYRELRDEISNTDAYEMRESLKRTEVLLTGVLEKLEPGWAASRGVKLHAPEQVLTPYEEYEGLVPVE
jgi:hypothetical protein